MAFQYKIHPLDMRARPSWLRINEDRGPCQINQLGLDHGIGEWTNAYLVKVITVWVTEGEREGGSRAYWRRRRYAPYHTTIAELPAEVVTKPCICFLLPPQLMLEPYSSGVIHVTLRQLDVCMVLYLRN